MAINQLGRLRPVPSRVMTRTTSIVAACAVAVVLPLSAQAADGTKPTPNTEATQTPTPECTINPPASEESEEEPSCVLADVTLDRAPQVGQRATATVTLDSEVDLDRAEITVRTSDGLRLVSGGFTPIGKRGLDDAATRTLSLTPEGRTLTFEVQADSTGPGQLQVDVADATDPAINRTAHGSHVVTVGKTAATTKHGYDGTTQRGTTLNGSKLTPSKGRSLDTASLQGRTTTAEENEVCAVGKLSYAEYFGDFAPARRVAVTLHGSEAEGAEDTTFASGKTDSNGRYSLCFEPAGESVASLQTTFTTRTDLWEVADMDGANAYSISTAPRTNVPVGSTQNFGGTAPDSVLNRPFAAFDVINLMYDVRGSSTKCWTSEESGPCSLLKARWAPGNTNGGYYSTAPAVRSVFLSDSMPDNPRVVVHEAGHNFHHLLYNWYWPRTDCPSPHYLHRVSGGACGWTEGFPNAIVGYVFGDGYYYYNADQTASIDLMQGWQDSSQPSSRENADNGADTEARVAGSMISLWKKFDGGPQKTFQNMDQQRSDTYEEWFNKDRPKTGLKVNKKARNLIYNKHTVDFRNVKQKEAITNGSFENQGEGWEFTNFVIGTYGGYAPRTGRYYSWMGGNGVASVDTMGQTVTVPKGKRSVLNFWMRVTTAEADAATPDHMVLKITVDGVEHTYGTWTNKDRTPAYSLYTIDVSAFQGKTVKVEFISTEDAGEQTDWVIDDVSLLTK